MENKKGISTKVWIMIICIILIVFTFIGIAAYIHYNRPVDVNYGVEVGGDVSLTYTDEENVFSFSNGFPMSVVDGISQSAADKFFDFTVSTDISNANSIK